MSAVANAMPILHAGHPIWYRGELAGVAANGEVYTVGWIEPRDRLVVRALAIAAFEAPHLTEDQQLSFAAYYVLPEERWEQLQHLPDELIGLTEGLPVDVVTRRRTLPALGLSRGRAADEVACA
jgi:hypothetical protein